MKHLILALFLLLPFVLITPADGEDMNIIRLHVIANSDSEYDQFVKLKVRDSVLAVSNTLSPEEIPHSLNLMEDVAKVAQNIIVMNKGRVEMTGDVAHVSSPVTDELTGMKAGKARSSFQ